MGETYLSKYTVPTTGLPFPAVSAARQGPLRVGLDSRYPPRSSPRSALPE